MVLFSEVHSSTNNFLKHTSQAGPTSFSLNMNVKETSFPILLLRLTYFGHYNDIPEEPGILLEQASVSVSGQGGGV